MKCVKSSRYSFVKCVQARSYQNGYYSNRTTVYVKDGDKSVTLGELSGDVE